MNTVPAQCVFEMLAPADEAQLTHETPKAPMEAGTAEIEMDFDEYLREAAARKTST